MEIMLAYDHSRNARIALGAIKDMQRNRLPHIGKGLLAAQKLRAAWGFKRCGRSLVEKQAMIFEQFLPPGA